MLRHPLKDGARREEPELSHAIMLTRDPVVDLRPAFMAYHFATVAQQAGLESEVRLAGGAVDILKEGGVPDHKQNERLINYMNEAVGSGLFVSV